MIRDAKTLGEVRSRIVEYHESSTLHHLLLYVLPGLAAAIMVALEIYNLVKRPDNAATGGQHGTAAEEATVDVTAATLDRRSVNGLSPMGRRCLRVLEDDAKEVVVVGSFSPRPRPAAAALAGTEHLQAVAAGLGTGPTLPI